MTMRTKYTLRLALVAGALMSPLSTLTAGARNAIDAYSSSSYGYCDAKKVAAVWRKSVFEAKAVIGRKILGNLQHLVDSDIASMKDQVRCNWSETQLSYSDAQKLAGYWGGSVSEAKSKATRMVSDMGNKRFLQLMSSALGR